MLPYLGYTLVVHAARHLAIYSAANADFSGRFDLARPKDVWLTDPRIPATQQVTGKFYVDNQFDRGHLTRREDMEYGKTRAQALRTAADTSHWTNCTPQHARFNEGRQLWQGIERHVLEDAAVANGFRAQVITGPIFGRKDPVLPNFPRTPHPLKYWKIAAAINAGCSEPAIEARCSFFQARALQSKRLGHQKGELRCDLAASACRKLHDALLTWSYRPPSPSDRPVRRRSRRWDGCGRLGPRFDVSTAAAPDAIAPASPLR